MTHVRHLAAVARDGGVELSWETTEDDIHSYLIQRNGVPLAVVADTRWFDALDRDSRGWHTYRVWVISPHSQSLIIATPVPENSGADVT